MYSYFRKLLVLVKNEDDKRQTLVASLLLCFGAGVLLSTSLLHILPESRAGLLNAQEKLGLECFAELVFSSGFFLVYFIEDLLLVILRQQNNSKLRPINDPESHLERSSKHLSPESSTSALRNFVTGTETILNIQYQKKYLQPLPFRLILYLRVLLLGWRKVRRMFGHCS